MKTVYFQLLIDVLYSLKLCYIWPSMCKFIFSIVRMSAYSTSVLNLIKHNLLHMSVLNVLKNLPI